MLHDQWFTIQQTGQLVDELRDKGWTVWRKNGLYYCKIILTKDEQHTICLKRTPFDHRNSELYHCLVLHKSFSPAVVHGYGFKTGL